MACKNYDKIIDKYIEGLATQEEKKALEKHLESCRACKLEVDGLKRLLKALNSFEPMELPEDFMPTLHSKLLKLKDEQKKSYVVFAWPFFIKKIIVSLQHIHRNFKVLVFGISTIILAFLLVHFWTMPDLNRQKTGGNPINQQMLKSESMPSPSASSSQRTLSTGQKDESKMAPDEEKAYEKNLMMAKNFQIAASTKSETQKRTVARAGNHMTRSFAPENKKSEEVKPKDIVLPKIDMQHEALQENGPKVASVKPLPQETEKSEELTLFVEDFDKKVVQVLSLVDKSDGSIEDSKIVESDGQSPRKAYLVLKVPAENTAKALEQIKALGQVQAQNQAPQVKSLIDTKPEKADVSQTKKAQTGQPQIDQTQLEQRQTGQTLFESKESKEQPRAKGSDIQKPMTIIRINMVEKPSNLESRR